MASRFVRTNLEEEMIGSVQPGNRHFVRGGRWWAGLLVTIALWIAATPAVFGQAASGTATITGLVTDATGAVVPGADVVVRNVDTNVARNLKSNDAGVFEAVSLQPGNYEVKIVKPGFAT